MGFLDFFRKGTSGKAKAAPPGQFSLMIAGYGIEATAGLPIAIHHQEQGPLLFSPIGPGDSSVVGENSAFLMPGEAPTADLELRDGPAGMPGVSLMYSSGQEGTTELHLMPGMESFEPLLKSIRVANRPPRWTVVTGAYEIPHPANLTLRATGEQAPHPLEFGLERATDDFVCLQGAYTQQAHDAFREKLVTQFGQQLLGQDGLDGQVGRVTWFEYQGQLDGRPFRQRVYAIPMRDGSRYLLRAQADDTARAAIWEAADLIARSFVPLH